MKTTFMTIINNEDKDYVCDCDDVILRTTKTDCDGAELCALLSRSRQQLRTDLDRPPLTFGGVYFFASLY